MLIKLNYDLLSYKKNAIINLEKVSHKEKTYFIRRIADSKIDNCVEIIKNIQEKAEEGKKKVKEEEKSTTIKKETSN